jgi:hypothetical protein
MSPCQGSWETHAYPFSRRLLVARKIVAVILQPVYDADGKLLYQPGDQLAEDHRFLRSIPPGTWRHEIVDVDEPKLAEVKGTAKPSTK